VNDKTCHGLPWFNNKSEKKIFEEQEYVCVFAAGPPAGRPLFLGRTGTLPDRMTDLKSQCGGDLVIHCIVWTAGEPLARRIVAQAEAILDKTKRRLSGNKFDVTPELARQVIDLAARKAGVPSLTHAEMLKRVRNVRQARFDAAITRAEAEIASAIQLEREEAENKKADERRCPELAECFYPLHKREVIFRPAVCIFAGD
jgi:hypothetical protein